MLDHYLRIFCALLCLEVAFIVSIAFIALAITIDRYINKDMESDNE